MGVRFTKEMEIPVYICENIPAYVNIYDASYKSILDIRRFLQSKHSK